MQKTIIYKSVDGKIFTSITDCREYEREASAKRLVGLKLPAIEAAIAGQNLELATAIKKVANQIPLNLRRHRQALSDPTGGKAGELLRDQLAERASIAASEDA